MTRSALACRYRLYCCWFWQLYMRIRQGSYAQAGSQFVKSLLMSKGIRRGLISWCTYTK